MLELDGIKALSGESKTRQMILSTNDVVAKALAFCGHGSHVDLCNMSPPIVTSQRKGTNGWRASFLDYSILRARRLDNMCPNP